MKRSLTEGNTKLLEQRGKYKQLRDEYSKFRTEMLGDTEMDTNDSQRRVEELQIENMELQRFAQGVKIGGSELERRFEEATRRLIHLGIQVSQHERKNTNLSRRHKALVEECERLRTQLMRLQSGDERKVRQFARENVSIGLFKFHSILLSGDEHDRDSSTPECTCSFGFHTHLQSIAYQFQTLASFPNSG
jgi:chromosome segregation ATPase